VKEKLILALAITILLACSLPVMAQYYGRDTNVHGYMKQNGSYVQQHHRTVPDDNKWNNYSTRGNFNPYTGQMGTVDPYNQPVKPYNSSNPFGQQKRRSWP